MVLVGRVLKIPIEHVEEYTSQASYFETALNSIFSGLTGSALFFEGGLP